MTPAWLALEDGRSFEGVSFGARGETGGEVVFNTSLTGYQEVLTDPSYAGQIVAMTYPHIGNYGVNPDDVESERPHVAGLIVREVSRVASSWRASGDLPLYLAEHGIVGMAGIDTRALTRHLRTRGSMRGVLSTEDGDPIRLARKARDLPPMTGLDLVQRVTAREPYQAGLEDARFRVVAYDFGMKQNIVRLLAAAGCRVLVVPAATPAADALATSPDGIFLSNGPGDPGACGYAVGACRGLIGRVPIFGICLGHQILGIACGGRTYKLKFGHRGGNHPVKNLRTGRIEVTAQNHGFAVDEDLFSHPEYELTHVNLNDGTVEGFRHRDLPLYSVQHHPEASPGPHDAQYLFSDFIEMMAKRLKSAREAERPPAAPSPAPGLR